MHLPSLPSIEKCRSSKILFFVLSITQATLYGEERVQNMYSNNGIMLWTEPDCKGIVASRIFNESTLGKNISNTYIARSFRLRRPFYFAVNGSGGCFNTPRFTCHQLWMNKGLSSDLEGLVAPSLALFSSSPFPLITASACYETTSTTPGTIESPSIPQVSPTPLSHGLSSQQHSSMIHTVQITGNSAAPFDPMYLDQINPGQRIKFDYKSPFHLIKSTTDSPCQPKSNGSNKLYYNVTESEPVWFYTCPGTTRDCNCHQEKHFALNSGKLLESVTDILFRIISALPTTTVPTSTKNDVVVTVTVTVYTTMPAGDDV
ncbi:hypothetical protein BJX62DRAFT_224875 [Aspergillus germanicus]